MAKNSIKEWDATPANNADIGGISILGAAAVSNFDNAFREIMSQIKKTAFFNGRPGVGTVSQSGGVANGDIIERGSNANGEYVKFADGTMICMKTIPDALKTATTLSNGMYRSASEDFTFPASFVSGSSPVGFGTNFNFGSFWIFSAYAVTTTAWRTTWARFAAGTDLATGGAQLIAIGRWY